MATQVPYLRSYVPGYPFRSIGAEFPIALLRDQFGHDPNLKTVIEEIHVLLQSFSEYDREHNAHELHHCIDGLQVDVESDDESEDKDWDVQYMLVNVNRDYEHERSLLSTLNGRIKELLNGEIIALVIVLRPLLPPDTKDKHEDVDI